MLVKENPDRKKKKKNAYDDVIYAEFVDSWKTQKSKYLENEIQISFK